MSTIFHDRREAGRKLAKLLGHYRGNKDVIVYALPRGGVIVGYEIAKELKVPLDIVITRKIGHPNNPEYALCAVAESGAMICNEQELLSIDKRWLEQEARRELEEARRRRMAYNGGKPSLSSRGKIAIVADDGAATGLTLRVALKELKLQKPLHLIAAVPVMPNDTAKFIQSEADELAVLVIPEFFAGSVGAYYEKFEQVSDGEVIDSLENPANS